MKKLSVVLLSSVGLLLTSSNVIASEGLPPRIEKYINQQLTLLENARIDSQQYDTTTDRNGEQPGKRLEKINGTVVCSYKKVAEKENYTPKNNRRNPKTKRPYGFSRWNKEGYFKSARWQTDPDAAVMVEEADLKKTTIKQSELDAKHAAHFSKHAEKYDKNYTEEQKQLAAGYTVLQELHPNSPYFKTPDSEEAPKITFGQKQQEGYTEYIVEGPGKVVEGFLWNSIEE